MKTTTPPTVTARREPESVAHTPLPWKSESDYQIQDSDGHLLATTGCTTGIKYATHQANRDLIVRAVNSHAALVEALEDMLAEAKALAYLEKTSQMLHAIDAAQQALAACEGGGK